MNKVVTMNKVTLLFGKRLFPLSCFSCSQMFQAEARCFSSLCSSYIHKQKFQPILPVQSFRQNGFLSLLKDKARSFIPDHTKVKVGSALAYEKVADNVNYVELFEYFGLPDTFQSWFKCIQLHMYIVLLVALCEKHGRLFRNGFIQTMWNDVELKLEKLATIKSSDRKKNIEELSGQFNAALIGFDEGILSDDKALAGACWRLMFSCQNVDPEKLESCVLYMRKQIAHISSINTEEIIYRGAVSFLPLSDILSEYKNIS